VSYQSSEGRRQERKRLLVAGSFTAYFHNCALNEKTNLGAALEDIRDLIIALHNNDERPVYFLAKVHPLFKWTYYGKNEVKDIVSIARDNDYLWICYGCGNWKKGIVAARLIGARKEEPPLSICCGETDPQAWGPLLKEKWVTITKALS